MSRAVAATLVSLVIPLLAAPSQTELLMEIMNYPLPERKAG